MSPLLRHPATVPSLFSLGAEVEAERPARPRLAWKVLASLGAPVRRIPSRTGAADGARRLALSQPSLW